MEIDPAALDPRALYRLMISVVVPRPIAWVSTRDAAGILNAAPFSYFQALSSKPPTVMISVGRKREGVPKDTRANIEATGEFVVPDRGAADVAGCCVAVRRGHESCAIANSVWTELTCRGRAPSKKERAEECPRRSVPLTARQP